MTFRMAPTRQEPRGAVVDLTPLVHAIEEFQGKDVDTTLEPDVYEQALKLQALKLVCAAARQLGPYLKALADRPGLMDKGLDTVCCMNKEEAVEILCRETNAALEDGNVGFEEVRFMRTSYAIPAYAYMQLTLTCICAALTVTHTERIRACARC